MSDLEPHQTQEYWEDHNTFEQEVTMTLVEAIQELLDEYPYSDPLGAEQMINSTIEVVRAVNDTTGIYTPETCATLTLVVTALQRHPNLTV